MTSCSLKLTPENWNEFQSISFVTTATNAPGSQQIEMRSVSNDARYNSQKISIPYRQSNADLTRTFHAFGGIWGGFHMFPLMMSDALNFNSNPEQPIEDDMFSKALVFWGNGQYKILDSTLGLSIIGSFEDVYDSTGDPPYRKRLQYLWINYIDSFYRISVGEFRSLTAEPFQVTPNGNQPGITLENHQNGYTFTVAGGAAVIGIYKKQLHQTDFYIHLMITLTGQFRDRVDGLVGSFKPTNEARLINALGVATQYTSDWNYDNSDFSRFNAWANHWQIPHDIECQKDDNGCPYVIWNYTRVIATQKCLKTSLGATFHIQDNTDYGGNDIGFIEPASIELCKAVCVDTPGCLQFSYDKSRASGQSRCWLKGGFDGRDDPDSRMTFIIESLPDTKSRKYITIENMDFVGNEVAEYDAPSPDMCQAHCDQIPSCAGFTYHGNACWLKSKMLDLTSFVGKTSRIAIDQHFDNRTYVPYDNTDLPGNDLIYLGNSASPEMCMAVCDRTTGCIGFSYDKTRAHGFSRCWLKSGVSGRNSPNSRTTYLVKTNPMAL